MSVTMISLPGRNVARIDSFARGTLGGRKVELALLSPAWFDEQGGYTPAESFSVTLFKSDVEALIAALQAAVAPIPKEVTP